MSIVVIPGANVPELADDDVDGLLAAIGFHRVPPADRGAYKPVLQSFMAVMHKIEREPDYTPPSLEPAPSATGRGYRAPTTEENPMNAWSHLCEIQRSSPSSHGLLQGRIFAIKDNIAVAGLPTTLGVSPELFEGGHYQQAAVDATVVARLLAAGAVVRGTSTCEGWCASPLSYTSFTGPVHHPWLRGHSSGGSSSGSAALVAAHQMPCIFPGDNSATTSTPALPTAEIALGSDQAGSVRIPASYCGIYGLKPTFGLVPYTGAASMSPMIDHLGVLAATLEDVAAVLETMAGYDGLDPRMTPESPLPGAVRPYAALLAGFKQRSATEMGPWTVGLLREGFAMTGVTDAVRETVHRAARTCFEAAGATVIDLSVPMHADGAVLWNAATRPSMASWLLQGRCAGHLTYLPPHMQPVTGRLPLQNDVNGQHCAALLSDHTPAAVNIMLSQQLANTQLAAGLEARAHRQVLGLRAAYDAALERVDILVTPCAPNVAPPLPSATASVSEKLTYAIGTTNNTAPFNVTGHPALSVPCGVAPSPDRPNVKLPVGMQLIGKRFEDDKVILAAALYERGRNMLDVTA